MRWVLGPRFDLDLPTDTPPAVKADVVPEFLGADPATRLASFRIAPYDMATTNRLDEIRVYLGPSGLPLPEDADAFVASPLPYGSANVTFYQRGADVAIPLPEVAVGAYVGRAIYGYEM